MSTQTITLRKVDVLSDEDINSRKDWLSARQRLLNRAQELRRLRDQLIVGRLRLELREGRRGVGV